MGMPYAEIHYDPCPNCGHLRPDRKATQGSSAWGHWHMCCSEACGRRLAIKIETGMVDMPPALSIYEGDGLRYQHARRVAALRNEIRWLRHCLRQQREGVADA